MRTTLTPAPPQLTNTRGSTDTRLPSLRPCVPGLADDVAFAQQLLEEESVFVLPGACFGKPNYFRIVT